MKTERGKEELDQAEDQREIGQRDFIKRARNASLHSIGRRKSFVLETYNER